MDDLLQALAHAVRHSFKSQVPDALASSGHSVVRKPIAGDMNRTGTRVSGWVHLGEIAVILAMAGIAAPVGLPSRDGADISAATPTSGFQGRDHGD